MPHPLAELCEAHDPLVYHILWDENQGCHYDHTHGHEPDETMFAAQASGWRFDFPWQTFSTDGGDPYALPQEDSVFENDRKHNGFSTYTMKRKGVRIIQD
jgi:hypothetical protein